jgi:hypothetical protein
MKLQFGLRSLLVVFVGLGIFAAVVGSALRRSVSDRSIAAELARFGVDVEFADSPSDYSGVPACFCRARRLTIRAEDPARLPDRLWQLSIDLDQVHELRLPETALDSGEKARTVCRLSQLQVLVLADIRPTDDVLSELRRHPRLQGIHLLAGNSLDRAGRLRIQHALPGIALGTDTASLGRKR